MEKKKKQKKALGRGLGNLLEVADVSNSSDNTTIDIELSKIKTNRNNPRKNFNQTAISELAQTIKKHGLLQPIIVLKDKTGYTVVSGERRLRACRLLKKKKVSCIIKQFGEQQNLEVSLIENIQREQLDSIEEGSIYKQLIEKYKLTQAELSENIGKNRATIANKIRLLSLPISIQTAVADGRLTEGQIRPLITVKKKALQERIFRDIVEKDLNSRQIEELVKKYKGIGDDKVKKAKGRSAEKKSVEIKKVESKLQDHLLTKVKIKINSKESKGIIVIDYYSLEELERIIKKIGVKV